MNKTLNTNLLLCARNLSAFASQDLAPLLIITWNLHLTAELWGRVGVCTGSSGCRFGVLAAAPIRGIIPYLPYRLIGTSLFLLFYQDGPGLASGEFLLPPSE